MEERLREFFAAYEARTNKTLEDPPEMDIDAAVSAFSDCFVEANPKGVQCGQNGDEFRQAVGKGFELYRSLGTKQMKIVSLAITPLDDLHGMAKVHWESFYRRKDGREERIEFDVIYLVQTIGDTPKIFAYITGDEQKAYEEKGLTPE